ncbi:BEM_collapsed_G0048440.mRNA.1.CDS.1 [Saccharomyces cerevisiae]|nr:BEM_collapsed_G0048440.mRNA.1.CDS.1 [Saccharomyces cerevisiae]
MESIFGGFGDLVVPRPKEHLGQTDLSFGGKIIACIEKFVKMVVKVVVAVKSGSLANCCAKYILEKSVDHPLSKTVNGTKQFKKVLELGSGTGLVGLCVGLLEKTHSTMALKNIELDEVQYEVLARELWWGEPLSADFSPQEGAMQANNVDLVLAADCVYLEEAFPLLEKTLLDLTHCINPPVILMAYKKRRKADKHFSTRLKRNFDVLEITDFLVNLNIILRKEPTCFSLSGSNLTQ